MGLHKQVKNNYKNLKTCFSLCIDFYDMQTLIKAEITGSDVS